MDEVRRPAVLKLLRVKVHGQRRKKGVPGFPQPLERIHLCPSKPSARRIHNTPKTGIVIVCDQFQISQDIEDLHSLIKAHAAKYLIRNIFFNQFLLHDAGQKTGAVYDGKIRIPKSLYRAQLFDIPDHLIHLLKVISGMIVYHGRTCRVLCKKIFFQAELVLLDQRVRAFQYLRCGPVILVQYDRPGRFVALVKFHEELHVRAAPLIDILIRVAHDHQIAVLV